MNKFKKLIGGFLLSLSLVMGMIPVTDVKAAETNIQEQEDNNSAQNANSVTVSSGKTVVNGSVQYEDTKEKQKDKYDWFKVTFSEQGKCDFKVLNLTDPTKSSDMESTYFDVYGEDFEECGSWKYGLAHDADDVYYLRVTSNIYGNGYSDGQLVEYQLVLNDDTSVEYVSTNHTSTSNAYMLTEGQAAFTLGWTDKYTRYFAIKVPKGKKAEVVIEPDADADLNEIIKNPFEVTIIRQSDGEELASGDIKKATTIHYIENKYNGKKTYLSGSDTYLIGINGGDTWSVNHQWVSVKYTLDKYNTDTKKPTISGVSDGKTYKKAVTIKYSDASGIKSAKLNGKKFKSGTKVSKNGSYTVAVTDKNGNTRTVKFKIKK